LLLLQQLKVSSDIVSHASKHKTGVLVACSVANRSKTLENTLIMSGDTTSILHSEKILPTSKLPVLLLSLTLQLFSN
jgi:hypothetical protein